MVWGSYLVNINHYCDTSFSSYFPIIYHDINLKEQFSTNCHCQNIHRLLVLGWLALGSAWGWAVFRKYLGWVALVGGWCVGKYDKFAGAPWLMQDLPHPTICSLLQILKLDEQKITTDHTSHDHLFNGRIVAPNLSDKDTGWVLMGLGCIQYAIFNTN